jgi:hypothetical protein
MGYHYTTLTPTLSRRREREKGQNIFIGGETIMKNSLHIFQPPVTSRTAPVI